MAISLSVKIFGDIDGLLTSLKKAEKEMAVFSRKVSRAGEELTKSLTLPIVGLGFVAVKNFGEAEKALASLEAQLRANGKDVKAVSADYQKFAQEIQNLTTVDDDAAIGLLQLAESMQSIDSKQAAQDAIGLSKAYGIDLNSAMKMVVQSQNGIYTMLGRTIPAIRSAKTEAEKAAIAHKAFADGFEIAKIQAQAGLGPLEQMKNKILDLSESFGKIIVTAITPLVNGIKKLTEWLDGLSESQRKWIVGVGLALAAVGPLLLVIGKIPGILASIIGGFNALIPIMKGIVAAIAANPWLALAAAIGIATIALLRWIDAGQLAESNKIMDQQAKREARAKEQLEEYIRADKKGRKQIIDGLREQAKAYLASWEAAKLANDTKGMEHYRQQIALINVQVDDMKQAALTMPPGLFNSAILDDQNKKLKETKSLLQAINLFVKSMGSSRVSYGGDMTSMTPRGITSVTPGGGLTQDRGITPPGTIAQPGALDINPMLNSIEKMKAAFASIGDTVGGIFSKVKGVFNSISDVVAQAADGFAEGWAAAVEKVLQVMSSVMSFISEIVTASNQRRMDEMDAYYDKERERIKNSLMTEAQKDKALAKLDKEAEKKRKELMREQAKDQKTVAIIQAIINGALAVVMALAGSPPPANFILAAIVGALAAVQIAMIASQPLPALAQGGLAYAPSMALVGDNPNARLDPEIISPLSKLKSIMAGSQPVEVYGVLRGEDILISSERAADMRTRTRGF